MTIWSVVQGSPQGLRAVCLLENWNEPFQTGGSIFWRYFLTLSLKLEFPAKSSLQPEGRLLNALAMSFTWHGGFCG